MRLWHLVFVVVLVALVLALARDPVGRVALIVFVDRRWARWSSGPTAVMALFQTIGALGEAEGLVAHAEAVAATGARPRRRHRRSCRPGSSSAPGWSGVVVGLTVIGLRVTDPTTSDWNRRRMTVDRLRPRDLPPPLAPRRRRAQDLGADRALVSPSSSTGRSTRPATWRTGSSTSAS